MAQTTLGCPGMGLGSDFKDLEAMLAAIGVGPRELGVSDQAEQGDADVTENGHLSLVDVCIGRQHDLDGPNLA